MVRVSTLTDWLREADEADVVALLRARPDLATPRPADTTVLAARAASRASVARAAEGLDTATLAVLDALLVAGADHAPVSPDALDIGLPPERVRAAVAVLRGLALAWGEPEVSLVPAAREVGNLPPSTPSPAPADVPGLLAALGGDERQVLDTLAHGTGVGKTKDADFAGSLDDAVTPIQRLLARGLLVRRDGETVTLPGQVAAVLRGAPTALVEPRLRTTPHQRATVDGTAAGEAMEFVRHVETLLRLWSDEPAPVRKAGGVGVREIRRLAKAADVSEARAGLLMELAAGAGLVADSGDLEPEWMPTTLADSWLAATAAHRWAALASAWIDLPRLPGLGGRKDARDKLLAPLSDDLRRPTAPVERMRVLRALPSDGGVVSADELAAVLAWRAPRRGGRLRDDVVRWTMAEATALGVVALGALSGPGHALLDEDVSAAAKRMAEAMPQPVDHVLVQADLTVVAPGPLEPHLAARVAEAADLESAGAATVYRVTETSLRRALDAGRSAEDLHELFRTRSRTPVPQGLTYLIDDVARRHGRLRGGAAACFLRCDDPALLAEVAASPAALGLRLRRIAPTVLVSPVPLLEVLEELRAAGFAPAAEGADGQIVDLRPAGRRVAAPPRAAQRPAASRQVDAETLTELVRGMRLGDQAVSARAGRTVTAGAGLGGNSAQTVALLSEAVRARQRVVVSLVDAHGVASRHVIQPVRVGAGVVEGTAGEQTHRLPLHRISAVSLVEE
ncbi:helicase-associated domain-containing protein [Actinokineospora fastidiosa]|uniref:helicase-associated domain-containing protein n=1 Tax=Actinokineospora fastidiosa TaxID=1816 RepID=UPI0016715D0D|nr:helicase-associated domain-containing protein [Actinokineospora fastidiosa]